MSDKYTVLSLFHDSYLSSEMYSKCVQSCRLLCSLLFLFLLCAVMCAIISWPGRLFILSYYDDSAVSEKVAIEYGYVIGYV